MKTDPSGAPQLNALRALLTSARGLVDDLVADPLVERILQAFSSLPEADREPIARVIERDAAWRQIVNATSSASGITVRPNPHASLYVHVCDPVTGEPFEPEPSPRDVEVIALGIGRFVRLLPLFFQEGVHEQWTRSARRLIAAANADLRALGARLAREVLAMIEEVDGGNAPAGR